MKLNEALELVGSELARATEDFGAFASHHEGYVVIKEEYEELGEELDRLWKRIKKGHPCNLDVKMRKEAVQLAAMAMRFLVDRC